MIALCKLPLSKRDSNTNGNNAPIGGPLPRRCFRSPGRDEPEIPANPIPPTFGTDSNTGGRDAMRSGITPVVDDLTPDGEGRVGKGDICDTLRGESAGVDGRDAEVDNA